MIRYLQLPFVFDAARLEAEVDALVNAWQLHFNQAHYEGTWSGLPLRAPGGNAGTLLADAGILNQPYTDTPLLMQCPYIRDILAKLDCPLGSVRLLKLERGAVVKEHTDAGLCYESGEVRLHIPVRTHSLVEFYLDGDRLSLEAGTCWYINATLPHRLANPSPVDRVHLVIDCFVNDRLQELFRREDLPVRSYKDTAKEDAFRYRQTLDALRSSGDPDRIRLADAMEGIR